VSLVSSFTNNIQELYVSFSQFLKPATSIYAVCKHTIQDVGQDLFQLSDGSRWMVDEADCSNFKTWKPGSHVVIVATNDQQKYEIVKVDLDGIFISSVKASLCMSPFQASMYYEHENPLGKYGTSAFEVVGLNGDFIEINYLDPLIQYPNPLKSKVSAESKEEMKRWQTTDVIMLGLPHSPNHPEYNQNELMLINCTLASHIYAMVI